MRQRLMLSHGMCADAQYAQVLGRGGKEPHAPEPFSFSMEVVLLGESFCF